MPPSDALATIAVDVFGVSAATEPRAIPYAARRFEAFRISAGGGDHSFSPRGFRTCKGTEVDGATLDEALASALTKMALDHKDHLVIRETGRHSVKLRADEPLEWLHVFAVKRRSDPRYVWEGHVQKRVHNLYPAHVVTIDAAALAGRAL